MYEILKINTVSPYYKFILSLFINTLFDFFKETRLNIK